MSLNQVSTQIVDWDLGDILAGSSPGRSVRIPGSTVSDLAVFTQRGSGKASSLPQWTLLADILAELDLAKIATTGSASDLVAGTVPPERLPSITNSLLDQVPALTLKGNNTGSLGFVKDLTVAEVKAMIGGGGGGSGVPPGPIQSSGLTMNSGSLLGRTSVGVGSIEEIGIGSGLTLSAGILSAAGGGGGVSSVAMTVPGGFSISGTPITSSGTLALGFTISGLLKGTGSAIAAAVAGTDYITPGSITSRGFTQSTATILGRSTTGTGAIEEISIGSGLSLSSGTLSATGGGGGVTSVGLSLPAIFSVTGSPITSSGTLTATLANQTANTVFSGPSSGGAATPTFRALAAADIPSLSAVYALTGAITSSGLTQSTARLLGRTTASTGAIEEISVGPGLTLSSGTLSATGSGSGDVTGPGGATDNALTVFDGATGKLIKNSSAILSTAGILSINTSVGGGVVINNLSTNPPVVQYSISGSVRTLTGLANTAGDIINSSVNGDMCYRTVGSNSHLFSVDNGATSALSVKPDGFVEHNLMRIGREVGTALTGNVRTYATDDASSNFGFRSSNAASNPFLFNFTVCRGSLASPAAIQAGDEAFFFTNGGYDGTTWRDNQAGFGAIATENWSGSGRGMKILFGFTPNGSTTEVVAMSLGSTVEWPNIPLTTGLSITTATKTFPLTVNGTVVNVLCQ